MKFIIEPNSAPVAKNAPTTPTKVNTNRSIPLKTKSFLLLTVNTATNTLIKKISAVIKLNTIPNGNISAIIALVVPFAIPS